MRKSSAKITGKKEEIGGNNVKRFLQLYFILSSSSSAKQIQSFETHLNGLTLANVLNSAEKLLKYLKQNSGKSFTATEGSNAVNIYLNCEEILKKICKNYLPYAEDLMKPLILSAISDVQTKLNRIEDLVSFLFIYFFSVIYNYIFFTERKNLF